MVNQRDEISFRLLEFTFCITEFSRFSHDLHVKSPRLFRIKISFNIYCVRNVDQAFRESLYLFTADVRIIRIFDISALEREKKYLWTCVLSEDSDMHAHSYTLIRASIFKCVAFITHITHVRSMRNKYIHNKVALT